MPNDKILELQHWIAFLKANLSAVPNIQAGRGMRAVFVYEIGRANASIQNIARTGR
jgi:hypothetical protein